MYIHVEKQSIHLNSSTHTHTHTHKDIHCTCTCKYACTHEASLVSYFTDILQCLNSSCVLEIKRACGH